MPCRSKIGCVLLHLETAVFTCTASFPTNGIVGFVFLHRLSQKLYSSLVSGIMLAAAQRDIKSDYFPCLRDFPTLSGPFQHSSRLFETFRHFPRLFDLTTFIEYKMGMMYMFMYMFMYCICCLYTRNVRISAAAYGFTCVCTSYCEMMLQCCNVAMLKWPNSQMLKWREVGILLCLGSFGNSRPLLGVALIRITPNNDCAWLRSPCQVRVTSHFAATHMHSAVGLIGRQSDVCGQALSKVFFSENKIKSIYL